AMRAILLTLALVLMLPLAAIAEPVDPATAPVASTDSAAKSWDFIPLPSGDELAAIRAALPIRYDPDDMEYKISVNGGGGLDLLLDTAFRTPYLTICFSTMESEPLGLSAVVLAGERMSLTIGIPEDQRRIHQFGPPTAPKVLEDPSLPVRDVEGDTLAGEVSIRVLWALLNDTHLIATMEGAGTPRVIEITEAQRGQLVNLVRFCAGLRAGAYEIDPGNVIQDAAWANYYGPPDD
ncbi:MAG: hypothetical protein ABI743_14785, partial [bacterium]